MVKHNSLNHILYQMYIYAFRLHHNKANCLLHTFLEYKLSQQLLTFTINVKVKLYTYNMDYVIERNHKAMMPWHSTQCFTQHFDI